MNKFCIVGLGEHSKSKLIPAIDKSKNILKAIVSRKSGLELKYKDISIFTDLSTAVKSLEKDVIFIIATPPDTHFKILKVVLQNEFNAMVEKPILLSFEHFKKIQDLSEANGVAFYECFMHRYGNIYKEFINIYKINKKNIELIEMVFCLPDLPDNTFRDNDSISSSVIYDIGCYPISLLNDLDITDKTIQIKRIENIRNYKEEKFDIEVKAANTKFNIRFGIDNHYSNIVTIKLFNGEKIKFEPFFYGREKEKRIVYEDKNSTKIRVIKDNNLFEEMFKKTTDDLYMSQKKRNELMIKNILDLDNIINQYTNFFN